MKNIANDYFDSEKPHTKIKHRLFKSTLDTSLSIANGINYSKKENKPYMYIDLFAGAGKFKNEQKGSPLIAMDSFAKYNDKTKRSFSNISMIVVEENT